MKKSVIMNYYVMLFSGMFGNPASSQPPTSNSSGGVLSMFGSGAGGDASSGNGPNSPAGFSFSFGGNGGPDSPRVGAASSQPFSLF